MQKVKLVKMQFFMVLVYISLSKFQGPKVILSAILVRASPNPNTDWEGIGRKEDRSRVFFLYIYL